MFITPFFNLPVADMYFIFRAKVTPATNYIGLDTWIKERKEI